MLLDVGRGVSILRAVRDALPPHVPTTISLRRAFDDSPESTDRFYEIVETSWSHGYSAVRVHGRTVEQKYLGRADWRAIAEVKRRYPDKTILGSGDVFTAEDAVRMLRETGVDVVWIARGAIGNPWIFAHAACLLQQVSANAGTENRDGYGFSSANVPEKPDEKNRDGYGFSSRENRDGYGYFPAPAPSNPQPRTLRPDFNPPTIHAQRDALREHFAIAMEIHGEQLAGRRMRKMGIKYSRFHPANEQVKGRFINVKSLREWTAVLDDFYAEEGPGIWPDPAAADEVTDTAATCEAGT